VLVLGIPGSNSRIQDPGGLIGERSPLAVGASGRVILAHLPDAEHGSASQLDSSLLARIRERGYDMSFGENHRGINGIAGPLLTADGEALGSVTIAGPSTRMTQAAMKRLAGTLLDTCRELSPMVTSLLGPEAGATVAALDL
jgi:DNA-binding IclR family transcriptional regulator